MDLYKQTFWTSFFDEMNKTAMTAKPLKALLVKPLAFRTPSTSVRLGRSNAMGGNNVISTAAGQLKGGASASSTHQVASALRPPSNVPMPTSQPMSGGSGATASASRP